jgi:hypothetical protein
MEIVESDKAEARRWDESSHVFGAELKSSGTLILNNFDSESASLSRIDCWKL